MLTLPNHPPASTTHHPVWRTQDGRWLKVAKSTSRADTAAIERDARVNAALGRAVISGVTTDGRATMSLPHLGGPLTPQWTPALARLLTLRMDSYQQTNTAGMGLPNGTAWKAEVLAKIESRATRCDPDVVAWCFQRANCSTHQLTGTTLVHTDAHLGNWVVDAAGQFHLIDWESAIAATPTVDRVVFFLAALITGNYDISDAIIEAGVGHEFWSAWLIKSATSTSWLAWSGASHGDIAARQQLLTRTDTRLEIASRRTMTV